MAIQRYLKFTAFQSSFTFNTDVDDRNVKNNLFCDKSLVTTGLYYYKTQQVLKHVFP